MVASARFVSGLRSAAAMAAKAAIAAERDGGRGVSRPPCHARRMLSVAPVLRRQASRLCLVLRSGAVCTASRPLAVASAYVRVCSADGTRNAAHKSACLGERRAPCRVLFVMVSTTLQRACIDDAEVLSLLLQVV